MKRCYTCGEQKPLAEFFRDKYQKDGFDHECKVCVKTSTQTKEGKETRQKTLKKYGQTEKGKETHRKAFKRYRQTEKGKETHRKNAKIYGQTNHGKEANKARMSVNYQITIGKIPYPSESECNYCNGQAQQYHHHLGYEREHWLDVIPVCISCHAKQH